MSTYLSYGNNFVYTGGGTSKALTFDKLNPCGLPPYTMRFEFMDRDVAFDPNTLETDTFELIGTWTHVGGSVWDFYYPNESWFAYGHYVATGEKFLFGVFSLKSKSVSSQGLYTYDNSTGRTTLLGHYFKILGANLTGVKYIPQLFYRMLYMQSVALFDTSMIENASEMFASQKTAILPITSIPDFNFSHVNNNALVWNGTTLSSSVGKPGLASFAYGGSNMTASRAKLLSIPDLTIPTDNSVDVSYMFAKQYNVQSGALSLYNKFNAAGWTGTHTQCFRDCGSNTETGAAELAQIPSGWK